MGAELGFEVIGHELVDAEGNPADGEPVSSTRIRKALRDGDLVAANEMLGRPHEVRGVVDHGDKRARELGLPHRQPRRARPTILPPGRRHLRRLVRHPRRRPPSDGDLARHSAPRSTSGPTTSLLEAHLIDFDGDLYGQPARVQFVERLRDELKFDSVEALVEQMARDVDQSRTILTNP